MSLNSVAVIINLGVRKIPPSTHIFGDLVSRILDAKQNLLRLQSDIDMNGFSASLHSQEIDCHASLSRLLQNQETLLKEKSRI